MPITTSESKKYEPKWNVIHRLSFLSYNSVFSTTKQKMWFFDAGHTALYILLGLWEEGIENQKLAQFYFIQHR